MAQTTDRTLAAQKRAEARRARKLARMGNQWAQGSLLVFTAVIMPFTNFFVVSDLVRQITVPEYIMEVIGDTPLYFGLYLAVSDQCILTSLRYDALEKVKALDPTLKTGYIMAMGVGNYYDLAAADIFSVESTFVTTDMVNALHLRGKQVHAWTIDEPANAERMIRLGVDNLITGDPEMVREVIQKSEQLGWFSYLSDEKWTELAEEMGVNMEEYASLLDAA